MKAPFKRPSGPTLTIETYQKVLSSPFLLSLANTKGTTWGIFKWLVFCILTWPLLKWEWIWIKCLNLVPLLSHYRHFILEALSFTVRFLSLQQPAIFPCPCCLCLCLSLSLSLSLSLILFRSLSLSLSRQCPWQNPNRVTWRQTGRLYL